MKTFNIEVSGKTLPDIINAIDEAKRLIESGYYSGFDSNEDGDFSFDSDGMYQNDDSEA